MQVSELKGCCIKFIFGGGSQLCAVTIFDEIYLLGDNDNTFKAACINNDIKHLFFTNKELVFMTKVFF